MNARERDQQTMHRLLREYLLGTLGDADTRRVDAHLADSADWREALESERETLALLDLLPAADPPEGLTGRVLDAAQRQDEAAEASVPLRRRLVTYGLVVGCLLVVAVVGGRTLLHTRQAVLSYSSGANLKQLGLVFKMYANESEGEKYPPLAPYEGVWTIDVRAICPKYLSPEGIGILVNPARPDSGKLTKRLEELVAEESVDWEEVTRLVAKSYVYTGWSVMDADDLEVLSRQYAKLDPPQYDEDVGADGKTVYRLREGIERFFISDINNPAATASAQSDVAVMFEAVFDKRRKPKGINVLYMDGHVEFIPYGEAFPALPEVDALLSTPEE
ncbi:MAG: zf-HC2 domain-containing protein [bacterium]|nr:zf-HC2 domain-containing protein [bacterium]